MRPTVSVIIKLPEVHARSLIERAEALGQSPEDPLLLFSVLYGFWVVNFVAFNGEALRKLASQFLALAEKQGASGPIVIGHRLLASSLTLTGDLMKGKTYYDKALALYDPAKHRALATRFGHDVGFKSCRSGRSSFGYLAIPIMRVQIPRVHSSTHVRSVTRLP
jgi:hypothetical protein